jgi:hypothetical protein
MGSGAVAGLGAVAGIYAGNKAASAQRRAAAEANNRIEAGKSGAIEQLSPYSEYGRQAFTPLSALMFGTKFNEDTGEFKGNLTNEERLAYFQEDPGYQYQLEQGIGALDRSAAASGMLDSGNTMKAVQQYGQDLANQSYSAYIDNLLGQLGYAQQADTNIANTITGAANTMANYSYAGGMANAAKYANLSNAAFNIAGQAAGVSGGGSGGGSGGQSGGQTGGGSSGSFFANLFSGG